MGFTFNGKNSDDFGFRFQTKRMPYVPPKRQTVVEVQGRDGGYVFEDGYDNIEIELACSMPGSTILERRKKARDIAPWLANTGVLVFDYESDIEYKVVKVVSNIEAAFYGREYRDEFAIIFTCEPYQRQTFYNDNLTWDEGTAPWSYTNIPWLGYPRIFNVLSGDTIDVENAGSYKASPLIILTGTVTSVTIGGFTFKKLSGTIYIDCKNQVVYGLNGSVKTNRIGDFSGNFPELLPGSNLFSISGIFTNLTITFDYKNTYL
jgi:predicted phage tail component-like protein